jgi:hypothetical protein
VVPLLSDDYYDVMETVGLLVDEETHSRLEWQIKSEEAEEIFADTWTGVKAE